MLCVNFKTVSRNIRAIRAKLSGGTRLCAVVKCDAYGLGLAQIAPKIAQKVDFFAVSTINEAQTLRNLGLTRPILLLGTCPDPNAAIDAGAIITITSTAELQHVIDVANGRRVTIHIKVNTGMNRYGITSPLALRALLARAARHSNIIVGGMYTHFSHEAHHPDGIAQIERQLGRFAPFVALFRRFRPRGIIHAAASGQFHLPATQFDMVRIGKALWGGYDGYKNAVELSARVVATQTVQKGANIGYGGRFTAQVATQIAVINAGYVRAGFLLLGDCTVFIDKIPCKIIGSINMDTITVDVSNMPNPIGKTAIIIGNQPGARIMDIAKNLGVSGAKILCLSN